jgi:hypothetical protein
MTRERLEEIKARHDFGLFGIHYIGHREIFDELFEHAEATIESAEIESTCSLVAKEIEQLKGGKLERMAMEIFPFVFKEQFKVAYSIEEPLRDYYADCAKETISYALALQSELKRVQEKASLNQITERKTV